MSRRKLSKIDFDIVPSVYEKPEPKKEIEIVSDSGKITPGELAQKINIALHDFYQSLYGADCTDRMIIDKTKNNTWRGCMSYIYDHVISHINTHAKRGDPEYPIGGGNVPLSLDTIEQLAIIYCRLCNIYNKPQSLMAFADLCGAWYNTFEQWGVLDSVDEVSARRKRIYKLIMTERRESIVTRLFDGGAAPLGTMTVFNNEVASSAQPQQIGFTAPEALPKLGNN